MTTSVAPLVVGGVELLGEAAALLAPHRDRVAPQPLYGPTGAEIYDAMASGDPLEIREILRMLPAPPGPVLELAAGAGRITLPLLAARHEVVALELSTDMIRLLEQRLAALPAGRRERCAVVQGDMAAFDLGRTFAAVVLGTTSVSLLDADQRAGLHRSVAAHLGPDGVYLLTTVCPPADAPRDSVSDVVTSDGTRYRMVEHVHADRTRRDVVVVPAFAADGSDPIPVWHTSIAILPPDVLVAELAAQGLETVARVPVSTHGSRLEDTLLVARPAREAR